MTLANLLSEAQILPELQSDERWAAIAELVDILVTSGKVHEAERADVMKSIRQREETMSTGIGFGIAIPHASSDRIDEVVACFGRSSKGIEFDAHMAFLRERHCPFGQGYLFSLPLPAETFDPGARYPVV